MSSEDDFTLQQLRMGAQKLGIATSNKTKQQLFAEIVAALPQRRSAAVVASYFVKHVPLTGDQQRYCRCLMHVAAKQPKWCLREKAWGQKRGDETCYNPFAVCTKSTRRRGAVECSVNFDFSAIPDDELLTYAYLFYDQVLAANGWQELPMPATHRDWRAQLEAGMASWIHQKQMVKSLQ